MSETERWREGCCEPCRSRLLDYLGRPSAGERWSDLYDIVAELEADERHAYRACGAMLRRLLDESRRPLSEVCG